MKKLLPFRAILDRPFPTEVQVQTHSRCNSVCQMCPYPAVRDSVQHGIMPLPLFERIVHECGSHDVREFKPFLMNEPLMDRRLPDLLRFARSRLKTTKLGLGTNAVLLHGQLAADLAQGLLDEIVVNVPTRDPGIYRSLMGTPHFQRVLDNVLRFRDQTRAGQSPMEVVASIVALPQNQSRIADDTAFWEEQGIRVVVTPFNNRGGHVGANTGAGAGKRCCDRPFFKAYVLFNGNLILCSSDWSRRYVLGNVAADGIAAVWGGERAKRIRAGLRIGDYSELEMCRSCSYNDL